MLTLQEKKIPFPEKIFDIVIANSVLEHIKNYKIVLDEMLRVLKDNGFIYIHIPNYLFPYEAHYKMFYFPLMPKFLGKFYLKLRGRNTAYYDYNIHYITSWRLYRVLQGKRVVFIDLGKKEFIDQNKNRLRRSIAKILVFFHLHPNVELIIKKKFD